MSDSLAVVLLSGGLDSCVTTALAAREHRLALLHVSYGQRTAERERRAFEAIARAYGIRAVHQRVYELRFLAELGHSALTDSSIVLPEGPPGEGIPISYVPFRNAHLLTAAVSWAEILGAASVWIGAVEEDSSGYPDCRQEFFEAFERTAQLGTKAARGLTIEAPLLHLRKAEIVRRGLELGAPLEMTWSCYQDGEQACGVCESCWLRLRAFHEAGVEDPIPYRR